MRKPQERLYKIYISIKYRVRHYNKPIESVWENSYTEFKNWSLEQGYTEEHSLYLKEGSKGYKIGNCIWALKKEDVSPKKERKKKKCLTCSTLITNKKKHTHCRKCSALLRRKDINIDRESYARNWALQKKYNISLLTFNKMREDQNNTCTICNKVMILPTKGKGQGLDTIAVDHCHTTGKVRGLLCSACNKGIGLLSDDINILENAIKYLKGAHNAKTSDNTESTSTS